MKKTGVSILVLTLFIALTGILKEQLLLHGKYRNLSDDLCYSDEFRRMDLSAEALEALVGLKEKGYTPGRVLASLLPWYRFQTPPAVQWEPEVCQNAKRLFRTYRKDAFAVFEEAMCAIWDDVVCFPTSASVSYENSWLAARNFEGPRLHEGCDLMPEKNQRDLYPVFSITSGVVEKIGWLPKGGYRIGIRSPGGGHFDTAHFSSYAADLQVGDSLKAGDLIGYMGNSGYGEEGTTGKFAVHLHLGIYIRTPETEELSVNPYWILRYLQFLENVNNS